MGQERTGKSRCLGGETPVSRDRVQAGSCDVEESELGGDPGFGPTQP